jgi:arginine decarboxylase
MSRLAPEDALEHYGLDLWGAGYFGIDEEGRLTVSPKGAGGSAVALETLVGQAAEAGLAPPLVFRFPQILAGRVEELVRSFQSAAREFEADGLVYRPAFPVKVNQNRAVIDALLDAGRPHGMSLEVGSRTELFLALGCDIGCEGMIIVNGYKDLDTLRLAVLGARMGRRVIVVVEKLFEVPALLEAFSAAGEGPLPEIGLRARLYARGAGKWWRSTGISAKFGLTTAGLLSAVDAIRDAGFLDRVSMLHFHIGSQIPEIRRFKTAFRESARIYAKLKKLGVPLRILDLGGGLAVDYDGSRTSTDASMNYSVQEYANDAVFLVRDVCSEEGVPLPIIVTESGRALAAYHALAVVDVVAAIGEDPPLEGGLEDDELPRVVSEMTVLLHEISAKNYREYFHDAVLLRDEMITLFNAGYISLPHRALCQQFFWQISRRALTFARKERVPIEEFEELERALDERYVLNFSVFQTLPDHWALDQLFPVCPLTRLLDRPTRSASLVDITCDSDGEVARFVDARDVKEAINLHELREGEPYRLALLMVGAYQDVMGNRHNLFGAPSEAIVHVDEEGRAHLSEALEGESPERMLRDFSYDLDAQAARVSEGLGSALTEGRIDRDEHDRLMRFYARARAATSYLSGTESLGG